MSIEPVLLKRSQLKNAKVISQYERQLDDGTKIYVNADGDISNRLISWNIKGIRRNGYVDRNKINAYLNLVNLPHKHSDGTHGSSIRMSITMQDGSKKSDYMIPINMGMILNFILMRDKIKGVVSINQLKNDAVKNNMNDVILTPLFKDMLADNCKFPIIVDEDEDTNNKSKIDINYTDVLRNIMVNKVDEGIHC